MDWRQFVMHLDSLEPDRVEAVLAEHGAVSVTLSDAGDDPVLEPAPGEMPLWQSTRITGLFAGDADLDSLPEALRAALGVESLPEHRVVELADREWEREWLRDFRPMRFGRRLWVSPHGFEVDADDAIVLRLDPGLAFGTGTHATTSLCLEWLDAEPPADRRLLDFGCGSGILAIAGLLLGARHATAVDIDAQAVAATEQNAAANGASDRLTATTDPGAADGTYDVIVANILAATLIELAPLITGRLALGGRLALSGVLERQADEVIDAYAPVIRFDPLATLDGWVRLTGTKR